MENIYEIIYRKYLLKTFLNYLDNIDDDTFVNFCEHLGSFGIQLITECLESDNTELIEKTIALFKKHYNKYVGIR